MIALSVPMLRGNETRYVTEAIEQEWVSTGGRYIELFEDKLAKYVKVDRAVSTQSGTAALHLALVDAGVCAGDEIIVPTLTFIAAVNPVKYVGAYPIFMDCDDTLCMDMDKLLKFIETECELRNGELYNKSSDNRIKAVIVVHVFGNMADMVSLMDIAAKYNLIVIEDAAEALGSYSDDGFAGTIGDYGIYSFNGNKIITTGGGGMVVAKNAKSLTHIKYLSTQAKDDEFNFTHNEIGYNYRMTNVQAAIGLAQLEKLEEFIETKKENYLLYKHLLGDTLLDFREDIRPNYWFYSVKCPQGTSDIIDSLAKKDIQSRPIWGLVSNQKPYQECMKYEIEKATLYQKLIINVPCSSNLTKMQVRKVVRVLRKAME
ncbi:MAG: aminotransferase DegT [Epulopiscium sp. Nuni2H_MBin001]|nr:MAG: aminotransferase DegT [Epulopiscium sp. Nuni2H_MBin001]